MGFKVGNPTLKSMTKSKFLSPSFLLTLELKHPCLPYEYFYIVFLNHFNDFLLWKRDRYSSVKGVLLLNLSKTNWA